MLRKIYFYSVFVTVCLATLGVAGEIDKDFKAKLLSMPPDSQITALIFIQDKVDLVSLVAQFDAANADRTTRHRTVIEALQAKANKTQSPFLNELASQKTAGEFSDYKSHWIDNVIYVKSKVSALLAAENISAIASNYIIKENVTVRLRAGSVPAAVTMQSFNCLNSGTARSNLKAINAHKVWEMGLHGEGRLLCIFDTGVELHDAFAARWRGNQPGVSASEAWFDPFFQSTQPFDTDFPGTNHGTRVTGIALGIEAPDTIGVAWGAQWIAALVIDRTDPTFDPINPSNAAKIIDAYEWAIDPDGNPNTVNDVPDVINNSWGHDEPCDDTFWGTIDAVEAAGIVNIIAVANDGDAPGSVKSPESRITTELVNFGIGDINTTVTPFEIWVESGRGPSPCAGSGDVKIKPEVVAPGQFICSSEGTSSYGVDSGTSFAAPHVSGTVALMRQANPSLTVNQIKQILLDTAIDFGPIVGNDNDYGYGMLDAHAAVLKALDDLPDRTSNSSLATAHNSGRRLVRDDSGNYHLVYQAGNQVFYAKYSGSWSSDIRISDGLGEYGYPSIVERSGNIFVTWQRRTGPTSTPNHDIYFHKSADRGATWPTANRQAIATNVGSSDPLPVIASPSNNNLVIAYRSSGNIVSKHSSNNGSTWPTTKTITGTTLNSPSMAPGKTPWGASTTVLAYATNDVPNASDIKVRYYYNGWISESNLSSGLPTNFSQHAHPSIAFSGDYSQNKTHVAWDAYNSFRSAHVILHKVLSTWNNPSTYSELYYQEQDRPSITGLSGATAGMVFQRNSGSIIRAVYTGLYWMTYYETSGTYPSISVGNTQAKYVYTSGSGPPFDVVMSTTTLSKGGPQTLAYSRAVGLVDEKSGASVNLIVENFFVKHTDGSISQVDFAPAPADTIEFSVVQALDALASKQFTIPTDADSLIVVYSLIADKAFGLKQADSPLKIQFKTKTTGASLKEQIFPGVFLSSDSPAAHSKIRMSVSAKAFNAGETIAFNTDLTNQKVTGLTVSLGHLYDLSGDATASKLLQTNHESNQPEESNLLLDNYPNPFNPETTIHYEIPNASQVEITIYNLLGKKIRTLVHQAQSVGKYNIRWDGKDGAGQNVASGVYLAKIKAGTLSKAIKMTLVR